MSKTEKDEDPEVLARVSDRPGPLVNPFQSVDEESTSDDELVATTDHIGASGLRGVPNTPPAGQYFVYDLVPLIVTRSGEVPLTRQDDRLVRDRRFVKVRFRNPDIPAGSQVWVGNVTVRVGRAQLQQCVSDLGLPVRGSLDRTGVLQSAARSNRINRLRPPSQTLAAAGVRPRRRPVVRSVPATAASPTPAPATPGSVISGILEGVERTFLITIAPRAQNNFYVKGGVKFPMVFAINGDQYTSSSVFEKNPLEPGKRYVFATSVGSHRF